MFLQAVVAPDPQKGPCHEERDEGDEEEGILNSSFSFLYWKNCRGVGVSRWLSREEKGGERHPVPTGSFKSLGSLHSSLPKIPYKTMFFIAGPEIFSPKKMFCGDFMVVTTQVVKDSCWSQSREFSCTSCVWSLRVYPAVSQSVVLTTVFFRFDIAPATDCDLESECVMMSIYNGSRISPIQSHVRAR